MSLDLTQLPEPLRLEQSSATTFEAPAASYLGERTVIFGGALLAQSIAAVGLAGDATKDVETMQLILVRPGDANQPVQYEVDQLSTGRTVATAAVTARQGDRVLSRALVLQSADEPDFIRHASRVAPEVSSPDLDRGSAGIMFPGTTSNAADDYGVDADPKAALPPTRSIWLRYEGQSSSPLVSQAILGWSSFGVLGPLNINHHEGIGTEDAHRTVMGAILTHTVHYLDRFDLDRSVLLSLEGTWTGRGRMHGQGTVFDRDGRLVATFANDALLKPFPDGRDHSADSNTIL